MITVVVIGEPASGSLPNTDLGAGPLNSLNPNASPLDPLRSGREEIVMPDNKAPVTHGGR